MKGCLMFLGGLVLLLLLGMGGCTGYAIYKGKQLSDATEAAFARAQATDKQFPFEPAPEQRLDPARIETFFQVRQGAVKVTKELFAKFDNLDQHKPTGFMEVIQTVVGAVSGFAGMARDVAQELSAGLEQHHMSLAEYMWHEERVFGILKNAADKGDPTAQEVVATIRDKAGAREHAGKGPQMDLKAGDVLDDLAARVSDYTAEELALVLGHAQEIQDSGYGLVADFVLLQHQRKHLTDETGEG